MPRRRKASSKNRPPRSQPPLPKKSRSRRKPRSAGLSLLANITQMRKYMNLVKDPCAGPLVRSAGLNPGTDFVERVRSSFSPISAVTTCGYVAWFPAFHGSGVTGAATSTGNLYHFGAVNPATNPTSTLALPLGTNTTDETAQGRFMPDPNAANLGSTSPFGRSKTSAACLQMDWLGTLASTQGQMCSIANLSLAEFNRFSGTAALFSPMSVDAVFAYAAARERIQMEGHEVIWAPSDIDCKLRTTGSETSQVLVYPGLDPDICFLTGVPATSNTWLAATDQSETRGILIAYRGFAAGSAVNLTFNAVKVVEHELAPRSGAIEAPISSGNQIPVSLNTVIKKMQEIDPTWQRKLIAVGSHLAGKALRGVVETYAPPVARRMGNSAFAILDGEL